MIGTVRTFTVNGTEYSVWSDFIARSTFAKNTETDEIKTIRSGGYIHNDLTVRKAIAAVFHLPTFRKSGK